MKFDEYQASSLKYAIQLGKRSRNKKRNYKLEKKRSRCVCTRGGGRRGWDKRTRINAVDTLWQGR